MIIRRLLSVVLCLSILLGLASVCTATSMHTTTSLCFSTVISGYDANNRYKFQQGSVHWDGYGMGVWPSGYTISYAPYTQDYTQSGAFVFLSYVGDVSYEEYYFSGKGYKANYRVGSFSDNIGVDTTFTYYV